MMPRDVIQNLRALVTAGAVSAMLLAAMLSFPARADETAVASAVSAFDARSWCSGWNAAAQTSAARTERYGRLLKLGDDRTEAGQITRIISAQLPLLVTVEPIIGPVRVDGQILECR